MNSLQRMLMSLALTPAVAIVSAQEVNVSGVVTDATGETIIGASVVEKARPTVRLPILMVSLLSR